MQWTITWCEGKLAALRAQSSEEVQRTHGADPDRYEQQMYVRNDESQLHVVAFFAQGRTATATHLGCGRDPRFTSAVPCLRAHPLGTSHRVHSNPDSCPTPFACQPAWAYEQPYGVQTRCASPEPCSRPCISRRPYRPPVSQARSPRRAHSAYAASVVSKTICAISGLRARGPSHGPAT